MRDDECAASAFFHARQSGFVVASIQTNPRDARKPEALEAVK